LPGKRHIYITHRDIEGSGFKILFEGEIVEIVESGGRVKVRRLEED